MNNSLGDMVYKALILFALFLIAGSLYSILLLQVEDRLRLPLPAEPAKGEDKC